MASMHFVADELVKRGEKVSFLTTGFSYMSLLRGDTRSYDRKAVGAVYAHHGIQCVFPVKTFHPQNVHNTILNELLRPLYDRYGALYKADFQKLDTSPEVVIIESGYSILLYRELRVRFPRSRLVYWVSDDPLSLRMHPSVLEADRELVAAPDVLKVIVSRGLRDRYPGSHYVQKGISVEQFDAPCANPYVATQSKWNVVSVGSMLFDRDALEGAASLAPEIAFHVIGPDAAARPPANVRYYGTLPFNQTVPFIKYADAGIAPYFETEGVGYISQSSLKMAQYSYCKRPIVCPSFASEGRKGFYSYRASDPTDMARAIRDAVTGEGTEPDPSICLPWKEVVSNFLTLTMSVEPVR